MADDSEARKMANNHKAQEQARRAAALREAMVDMIGKGERTDDGGKALFAYAHPLFWAPFALIGDGENR